MLRNLGYREAQLVKHFCVILVLKAEVEIDAIYAVLHDADIDLVRRDHMWVLQLILLYCLDRDSLLSRYLSY